MIFEYFQFSGFSGHILLLIDELKKGVAQGARYSCNIFGVVSTPSLLYFQLK